MSIILEVNPLSGKSVFLQTESNATVDDFKRSAQSALSTGKARHVTASAHVLDGARKISECGLHSGDSVALHVGHAQALSSRTACAAILGDGSAVAWGFAARGGDSRAVQHQLTNVQIIQASDGAFAALLNDGSVGTWIWWRQHCATRPAEKCAGKLSL